MSNVRILFVAGLFAFVLTTTKASLQGGSEAVNGLLMSILHDDAATGSYKEMQFVVAFRNLGTEDMKVTPGTLYNCGNDGSKTDFVKVNLVDSAGIRHRHLGFLGDGPPYRAGCGGQMTMFVATIRPGESILLPLDLSKYLNLSDSPKYVEARFHAGMYSLHAELTGPIEVYVDGRPTPKGTWIGTVTSNILQVRFDKEFAAPLGDYPK